MDTRSACRLTARALWAKRPYFGAAARAVACGVVVCGVVGCGSNATSTTANIHGDSTADESTASDKSDMAEGGASTAQTDDATSVDGGPVTSADDADVADAQAAASSAQSEGTCAACVIIERTPELEEGEWIDEDRVTASLLNFENVQDPVEIPLTPPGHLVRSIVWGRDRELIVARHEEPPQDGQPGLRHISVFASAADFVPTEIEPPASTGAFGVTRVASALDDWPSILSHQSEDGLTTYYAYDLDPESDGDRNLGAITEAAAQLYAYPMPRGHGVIFRSPLPGGTSFDCQWHHWDNGLPAALQHLVDASCTDAIPRFSADGRVFAMRLEDEEDSQRERAVIYDSATLEPVMTLPSADQARLIFGPEGSRFAYHLGYSSLVGDVGTTEYSIIVGDAARQWSQNIAEWGRVPLGGVSVDSTSGLWPLFFTGADTLMVRFDEPYLVSFAGGPWQGLGNPTATFDPFFSGGQLGYVTSDGIYLVEDDFVEDSRLISHDFDSEQVFIAPTRIPGGFAYQTFWWVDDVDRQYRLRATLDQHEPVAIEGIDERDSYFTVLSLEASVLDGLEGSLLHAPGGDDLGQLYYLAATLEPTLLATDVVAFR